MWRKCQINRTFKSKWTSKQIGTIRAKLLMRTVKRSLWKLRTKRGWKCGKGNSSKGKHTEIRECPKYRQPKNNQRGRQSKRQNLRKARIAYFYCFRLYNASECCRGILLFLHFLFSSTTPYMDAESLLTGFWLKSSRKRTFWMNQFFRQPLGAFKTSMFTRVSEELIVSTRSWM